MSIARMGLLQAFEKLLGAAHRPIKHPRWIRVGERIEQTKSGRRRTVTRVTEEKFNRWNGADLRALRAQRGVGQRRRIKAQNDG